MMTVGTMQVLGTESHQPNYDVLPNYEPVSYHNNHMTSYAMDAIVISVL